MKNQYAKGYESTNFFSEKPLFVNNAGFVKNNKISVRTSRPTGRLDYHLIIVEKGEIVVNGKSIKEKQGYLFYPNSKQFYEYKAVENCCYYWLHFSGSLVGEYLSNFNLLEGFINIGERTAKVVAMVNEIIVSYNTRLQNANEYSAGQLLSIISLISSINYAPNKISKATQILNDLSINIPIREVALECGMSEGYFIREFKKAVGVSPQNYRLLNRIKVAKELLCESSLSITEISYAVGFEDPLYFSRIFKSKEGVSPNKYRSNCKYLKI